MPKHSAIRKNPEREFQKNLVRDLRSILPQDCFLTAFPAGGGGKVRGGILKASGLVAGCPDLWLVYRGFAYGLELKAKSGRLSEEQKFTHDLLGKCGMDVRTIRSHDEALAALKEWNIPTRIVGEWTQKQNLKQRAAA